MGFYNYLFMIIALVHTAKFQDRTQCITPNNKLGKCISIKDCEPLIALLQSAGRNSNNRDFVRRSQCGFLNNLPYVCCPESKSTENNLKQIVFGDPNPPNYSPVNPPPNTQLNSPTNPVQTSTSPPINPIVTGDNTGFTSVAESVNPSQSASERIGLPSYPECGLSGNESVWKIVGGFDAKLGQFPWMAALGYDKNRVNPEWLCGGSLITRRHVLTAAHCVLPQLYVTRMGVIDINNAANAIDTLITDKIVHEEYSSRSMTNDIALLKLEKDVVGHDGVAFPICLPLDPSLRSQSFVRYLPYVAGWGSLYFRGPSSNILQGLQISVISTDSCVKSFAANNRIVIDNRVICAGFPTGGKDACKGDSGGPLMLPKQARDGSFPLYEIGIVSYGYKCAEPGYSAVYTRVSEFIEWIQDRLN